MNFLRHLGLRQKFLLLTLLLVITAAVLAFTQWTVERAGDNLATAIQQRHDSWRLADALRQSSDDLTRMVRAFVTTADPQREQQYNEILAIRAGTQPVPAGYDGIYWDFRVAGIDVPGTPGPAISLTEQMKLAGFTDAELSRLEEANQKSAALAKLEQEAMTLARKSTTTSDPDTARAERERAREMVFGEQYNKVKADIMQPINEFFRLLNTRTLGAVETAEQSAAQWRWIQVASSGFMLALFFLVFYSVLSHIITSIQAAVRVSGAVARGDLTQQIEASGRDEIAQLMQALARMQHSLIDVVSTVRLASGSVANASSEIAQGNLDLSSRTESQASALEETAASMEELSSTVMNNAVNATSASELAQGASSIAARGGEVVARVVDTMREISESSHRVAEIIGVIDGIAFQTNLLALNAAVEAARAGEHGRGFAVVAGEVRNLAGRAGDAAREIKQLITDSVARVEAGTTFADSAGSTMNEMVASIQRVASIMGDISVASSEQSAGVNQVGEAIAQIDQATQQNAAMVEEMAAAAGNLEQQAQELVQAVAVFQIGPNDTVKDPASRFSTHPLREAPPFGDTSRLTEHKSARQRSSAHDRPAARIPVPA